MGTRFIGDELETFCRQQRQQGEKSRNQADVFFLDITFACQERRLYELTSSQAQRVEKDEYFFFSERYRNQRRYSGLAEGCEVPT